MVLTCPRCATEVPIEALYCPYCSLPKPKLGFAAQAEVTSEAAKPADQRNPRVAFKSSSKGSKPAKRSFTRTGKPPRRLRVGVPGIAGIVALLSVGIYIFVIPLIISDQAEPKSVLSALDKLRKSPSNEAELTIEARLSRDLETARRVKNLVAYQGWIVRPIKGTKTKVMLVFSYEEVGDIHQTAEWMADLTSGTFTPQTELATAVSSR